MTYRQLSPGERYVLAVLRRQGLNQSEVARPYHSWERGSSENANGLLRQHLPKGASMAGLSQHQRHAIAHKLNTRPRKRLGFRTPLECYNQS